MKNRAIRLSALAALIALSAGARAEPVRVGSVEVLTGPNAQYGIAIREGLELALDDIKARAPDRLTLMIEDSAGDKQQAINAVRKLIGSNKVSVIIGPTTSGEMFAAGPVANGRSIPIIGTSTTAKGVTDIGPYVFSKSLPEEHVLPVTLQRGKERLGLKKVAVMYADDDAFAVSAYEVFHDNLAKLGIETALTERFGAKDADFSAQLTRIKAAGVQAIIVSSFAEAAASIMVQARRLGIPKDVVFIGGNGFLSPKLGEIAGSAADGTLVGSTWFIDKPDPINSKFVETFRKKWGHDPDQFSAHAYDAMLIVDQAIEKAGSPDGTKIRDALTGTKFTGATGPFTFDANRNPGSTEGVVLLTIQNGKFQLVK